MPAAPQEPAAHNAPFTRPPNTTSAPDSHAHATARSASIQPAPAVSSTRSHASLHTLPRRFLGPMPENVVNSAAQVEKARHFRNMRRRTVRHWTGRDEDEARGRLARANASLGLDDGRRGVRRAVHRIRAGRAGDTNEFDLDDDSDSDDDDGAGPSARHGKKQKRKDVWIGESFDIGQEFRILPGTTEDAQAAAEAPPTRPPNSTQTTQESFYTARTEFSDAVEPPEPDGSPHGLNNGNTPDTRRSQSSSMQPLLPDVLAAEAKEASSAASPSRTLHSAVKPMKSALDMKSLKSALRRPRTSHNGRAATAAELDGASSNRRSAAGKGRSKSVQFPMDPVQSPTVPYTESRGDEEPVDPQEVLSRRGEEAEGTSHGAVEEAIGEDEVEEEEFVPIGQVIMRGEWITLLRI